MNDGWERAARKTVQQIDGSAVVISLVPHADELDIHYALQLGAAIMLDKPIIGVARPGTKIPRKLMRVIDELIEVDLESEHGKRALEKALKRRVE